MCKTLGLLFDAFLFFNFLLLTLSVKAGTFSYTWENTPNRTWVGEFFWANRLQDWQIKNGRLESVVNREGFPFRTVHILPLRVSDSAGSIHIEVHTGIVETEGSFKGDGITGILIGAGGNALDYKAAALIHHTSAQNAGILAGISLDGQLHIAMNAKLPEKKGSIDHPKLSAKQKIM